MMTRPAVSALLLTVPLLMLTLRSAQAYRVYESSSGAPLRWFVDRVTITFDSAPPQDVTASGAQAAVEEGYKAWTNLSCGSGPVPFSFPFSGPVSGQAVGHVEGAANTNLVLWVNQSWFHDPAVTALTTLTFDRQTGEIVDADLEFNDVNFTFSLNGAPGTSDVLNTVTHEAGHVLGLDHSAESTATMFTTAELGETIKRSLTQDDVNGFCSLYGPDAPPTPDASATSVTRSNSGCKVSHKGSPTTIWIWVFMWTAMTALGRVLSRRTQPPTPLAAASHRRDRARRRPGHPEDG